MDAVILGVTALVTELVGDGTPLSEPVGLIAIDTGTDASGTRLSWPLSWDVADIAMTQDQLIGDVATLGTVVNDSTEATALRSLRQTTLTSSSDKRLVRVDTSTGGHYNLFIRDELPQSVATAIDALLH